MGTQICIIANMISLPIQYCPTRYSPSVDCCLNIAVYCCVPPGAGGVDPPKFIVTAVSLHGLGLMGCDNYPCLHPHRPMHLFPSLGCHVVCLHPYIIAKAKGCDISKSTSVQIIIERLECGLWAMQSFPTCSQSRCAFFPASWLLVWFDTGCRIPLRGVDMSIDMSKSTTHLHQNDVAAPSAVGIFDL